MATEAPAIEPSGRGLCFGFAMVDAGADAAAALGAASGEGADATAGLAAAPAEGAPAASALGAASGVASGTGTAAYSGVSLGERLATLACRSDSRRDSSAESCAKIIG